VPSFVPLPKCGGLTIKKQSSVQSNHYWHNISHSTCEYRWGFGLVTRFIDHLQVATTSDYDAIVISTFYKWLYGKSSPVCSVFTRRCW
jgi:hypothetical protein